MEESERFWSKVNKTYSCWVWTGAIANKGEKSLHLQYGQFRDSKFKRHLAHRYSYESLIGPIPEGLIIDHLCRNGLCVNPSHLEPVTQKENSRRGMAGRPQPDPFFCGHLNTKQNRVSIGGKSACRICRDSATKEREGFKLKTILASLHDNPDVLTASARSGYSVSCVRAVAYKYKIPLNRVHSITPIFLRISEILIREAFKDYPTLKVAADRLGISASEALRCANYWDINRKHRWVNRTTISSKIKN